MVAELGGTFLCHRLLLSLDLNSFILISPPFSFSPSLLHPHSAACVATVIAIFLDHPGFFYFSIPHSLSPCHVMEGVLTCVFFWDLPMVTWLECAKTMFEWKIYFVLIFLFCFTGSWGFKIAKKIYFETLFINLNFKSLELT